MTFVASAGNCELNANENQITRAKQAIVVGSVDYRLKISFWANFGSRIDILAPGDGLNFGKEEVSGTSFSAPIVSGLAAYFLSLLPENQSQYAIGNGGMKELLRKYALPAARLTAATKGTTNLLANNGIQSWPGN